MKIIVCSLSIIMKKRDRSDAETMILLKPKWG
jgi:hypothetical protein